MKTDEELDEELEGALGCPEEPTTLDDILERLDDLAILLSSIREANKEGLYALSLGVGAIFLILVWKFFL